jgi:phosphatidylglycerol:prolipoprotein diacylglycerol transferase
MRAIMPLAVIPYPHIDPVLFAIGSLEIRWYALAYMAGFLIGWLYARWLASRPALWGGASPLKPGELDDFVLICVPAIVLGGRIGYVLFYNLPYYIANPVEMFEPWTGGMSFHGALLGALAAECFFSRWRKVPFFCVTDIVCAVAPIGLMFGRLANFINGELWGRVTDVPWAMVFPDAGPLPRHPSQLYEATLEGFLFFIALALLIRAGALRRPGTITGVFMIWYGCARIVCEMFRQPDVQLGFLWGGLTMGMLLSIPLILVGIGVLVLARRGKPLSPTRIQPA